MNTHKTFQSARRRTFVQAAVWTTLAACSCLVAAQAQDYPNKPIRIIGPFSPGSGTDNAARLLAEGLGRKLGQSVIVENRPGANTMIGTAAAAKAPADGYTMVMIFVDNMALNPAIRSDVGYKTTDFDPVAIVGQIPLVILGRRDLPYNNIGELRQAARNEKKTFSFGTWGQGSVAHVVGAMLAQAGPFDFDYIPYSGSAPSTNAVMGGHVDLAVATPATAATVLSGGKAKVLAVGSPSRLPEFSQASTLAESGLGTVNAMQWHGIAVRAGGDAKIINRLSQAVAELYTEPETRARFLKLGYSEVGGMSPADFKTFIQRQSLPWAEAVKRGGITP